MTTDFQQLQQLARALGLSYQQVLARYHAERGAEACHSGAIPWARLQVQRVQEAGLRTAQAERALLAGFVESQVRSWAPLGFALVPEVQEAVEARVGLDRVTMPRLSVGHYLDAALRTGPDQLAGQLACLQDFVESRGGAVPKGCSSVYFVGKDAYSKVSLLRFALVKAGLPDGRRHAVLSALTADFLDRLPSDVPFAPAAASPGHPEAGR
ncbi:hypothetical protein ACFV9E_35995 [Streptomyces sp. NPDC059835]|uniref:hypothetical protein n=1 Tax=Streptomyces sp. NPDC059835 TaxID=3346967 RepID=UPI00365F72F2